MTAVLVQAAAALRGAGGPASRRALSPAYSARLALAAAVLLALAGCASNANRLYQWGQYEAQVYAMYSDPGKVSAQEQITALEADYQKARARNQAVPPGWHAHLGYLYFELGKVDQALQSFQTEKALFPESAVYMDRLIARIKK